MSEDWQDKAQPGELAYHVNDKWRPSEKFMRDTAALFESYGYKSDDYTGKRILDIGAGSRLRSKYFIGSEIIAIEPLAEKFINVIEWCDLPDATMLYTQPAERFIPELKDTIDLTISINVLDHCFDFRKIIYNIAKYIKPVTGRALLSFDSHSIINTMHPLMLNEHVCEQAFKDARLEVVWYATGAVYGHGEKSLTYLLRRL